MRGLVVPDALPHPVAPPATAAPPHGGRELDRSLIRGIAWTGAMRWATQLLGWASTLIVARLLAPTDYGLVGMAMVYLGFIHLINEFGLGTVIVQRRDLTADQLARIAGFALLLGLGFVILSALVSGAVAEFFGEPSVRWIIPVASLAFLTSALQVVPQGLLTRDLDFRRLAWADGAEAVLAALATLVLAALGIGYWALVLGPLAGRLTSTVLVNIWRPQPIAWPRRFGTIASAVSFGWHLVVSRLAWYLYSNADFTIVGRLLGKAALGAYTIGWTLASIPVDRITALVASVTPPVFSAVQHDPPALQRYLKNLTEALALITFPAAIGMALIADEFVPLVLGTQWRSAVAPLQLLALSAALRSVSPLLPQIIVSRGHAKVNMQLTLVTALVLPVLFYFGSRWGTAGVAAAWLVGHPLLVMPLYLSYALRLTGLPLPAYLKSLWPAASTTLAMAAAVWAVRLATPDPWRPSVKLAAHIVTGAVVYVVVLYGWHRPRVRALWTLLHELRG
jgi:O-antigen/teichoic acid export membrane protein